MPAGRQTRSSAPSQRAAIRIPVSAGARTYPIVIEEGLTSRLADLLATHEIGPRLFAISNPLVWRLHGTAVKAAVPDVEPILIPDGERHKTLRTVSRIYEALLHAGADRSVGVLAVGGGVVGDTVGFAAATYLRGVNLVHLPTTLLAQVDSAVGGKVGVNHPLAKNLIGAFYPPVLVASDPLLLPTLPRRELRSGLYEVVKYGMIASHKLFVRLEAHLSEHFAHVPDVLVATIAQSCRIKARIVSADERESGPRRILNFGHTAGHALESLTSYRRFRHGEAVAYGMLVAAEIGKARGTLSEAEQERLVGLIRQMGPLPPIADLSAKRAIEVIRRDKKVVRGRLHFVLPEGIGSTTIVDDVGARELERAMRRAGMAR